MKEVGKYIKEKSESENEMGKIHNKFPSKIDTQSV